MKDEQADLVKWWSRYQSGISYNQALIIGEKSYYDTIDVNIAFSNDDQWRNVEAEDISKPTIPILQKAKQYSVANVTSTAISATIQPEEFNSNEEERNPEMQGEIEATEMANAEIRNIFDRTKFEFKVREGLGDAFDMGDMCLHTLWNAEVKPLKGKKFEQFQGQIDAELVDGPNIMFGNGNNADPQIQPYIIVVGRELATTLQDEAKTYKETTQINEDTEWEYQAGDNGKIEVEADKYGKALYIIVYEKDKKTGKVKASKLVQNSFIYKDIDTELTRYPIAWFNYKKQKNQYHGRAGATGLISNQIAINKLLAMIIYSVMKTAFPTMVYNGERMSAPTNEIGKAIPLRNMTPGENVNNVAGFLQTGQVAQQTFSLIEMIITHTKDMLGITDAAVGNVNPDNTSAMALAEKLTSVPLENVRSNLYEFTEQFVDNLLDMMGAKYGTRPVKITDGDNTSIQIFDFSKMKELNVSKRIDVGSIGYASELSSLKDLRDLLELGAITVVEYLERLPEHQIPEVKELIEQIKKREGLISADQQEENNVKFEEMVAFIETLPPEVQEQLRALPDDQLEIEVERLMAEGGGNNQQAQGDLNQLIGG